MRGSSRCADQHFGNLTNIRPMHGMCRSHRALHPSVIEIMKTLLARSSWHKVNGGCQNRNACDPSRRRSSAHRGIWDEESVEDAPQALHSCTAPTQGQASARWQLYP